MENIALLGEMETSPSNLANGAGSLLFPKNTINDIREKREKFKDIAKDLIEPLNRKNILL